MIKDEFKKLFSCYVEKHDKKNLTYVITSTDRSGNPKTNPHAIKGNAMDFTLRTGGAYSTIKEYNDLFMFLMFEWPYRAGIDNTEGNIHIHLDLGKVLPDGQFMPFFFKENGGKFQWQIKTDEDLYRE